jgi:hypothetical protein
MPKSMGFNLGYVLFGQVSTGAADDLLQRELR